LGSAAAALILLVAEHVIGHGKDLNPIDHWLSEYVLSASTPAVWLMRLAFLALATAAVSVAALSREKILKAVFGLSAVGLAAMPFLDSDPNDGRSSGMNWPLTHGNLHQLMLYLAIGSTLLGIGLRVFRYASNRNPRRRLEAAFFAVAIVATIVQFFLVAASESQHQMTRFGGVTERVIVVAMLAWVISFCCRAEEGKPSEGIAVAGSNQFRP
jgi:hypothetical protein